MSEKQDLVMKQLPSKREFITFQLSVLLPGGLVVMPLVYYGAAALGLLGENVSALVNNYSYGNLVALSIATLVPSMVAFGRELVFNPVRFVTGLCIVAFLTLRAYAQLRASVSLPLPLGGGAVGIAVAALLGRVGVAACKPLKPKQVLRYALVLVTSFVAVVVTLATSAYFIKWRTWRVETAIVWESTSKEIQGVGEVIRVQSIGPAGYIGYWLDVQLDNGNVISVIQGPFGLDFAEACMQREPRTGSRIRFEGTYYSREFAASDRRFDSYDLESSVGLIDSRSCVDDIADAQRRY